MIIQVKKLYNGYATIRDYTVSKCYKSGEDLIITYGDKSVKIKNSELPLYEKMTKKQMISKFDGKPYYLCDFPFSTRAVQYEETGSLFSQEV